MSQSIEQWKNMAVAKQKEVRVLGVSRRLDVEQFSCYIGSPAPEW